MRTLFIISFFISVHNLCAQNEGNIWCFGQNAGIDFNSGMAVALLNTAMSTPEGCSSISDYNGNLLFYTNGETVFNSNHVAMPNGNGLSGHPSCIQSCIIVKKPGSSNVYVVFTLDAAENLYLNGLQYFEVDMSLQGGLGDVSATVTSPIYAPSISEQLTAIRHQNGIDYWVIIRANDSIHTSFRSYLFTAAGLSTAPIINNLFTSNSIWSAISASPNGEKLATSSTVFDFDKATGIISNEIILPCGAYDSEFSPNNRYFYSTRNSIDTATNLFNQEVLQFDLLAGSVIDIINSEVVLSLYATTYYGAMQLGPDHKIYMARVGIDSLAVISDPDLPGMNCNFDLDGFPLAIGTHSMMGLPAFVTSTIIDYEVNIDICQGDSVYLYGNGFQNYNWAIATFPGSVISTDSAILVSPNVNTSYIVYNGTDTAFYNVIVNPLNLVDLGPDLTICPGSVNILVDINSTMNNNNTYLWQNGSINDSLDIYSTGTYWLEVTNTFGCVSADTILVTNIVGLTIVSSHPVCHDATNGSIIVNLRGGGNGWPLTISNNLGDILNLPGTYSAANLPSGTYIIEYSDGNCMAIDSIILSNPPLIDFSISTVNPLCNRDASGVAYITNLSNFQGGLDSVYYNWTPNPLLNNGLYTDSIWGLYAGTYVVEVVDQLACQNSIVFDVVEPNPLMANIVDISPTFCRITGFQSGNGSVTVEVPQETAGTGNAYIHWQHLETNETSHAPMFVSKAPGNIMLTVTDDNGCVFRDTVYLDSLTPIADFLIESDEFDISDIYEGTEYVNIRVTNNSAHFFDPNNANSDIVFQWNLFNNQMPSADKNWFFTYSLGEKVDTIYEGEQVYQVCLIAKNYNDCADTTCKDVIVHAKPLLYTPNVFTPGSMPNNEFFFPSEGIQEFECTVFNRYGAKVYEFNDITDKWDGDHFESGEKCSDGVYHYSYRALSTNGKSFSDVGHVTLLRSKS